MPRKERLDKYRELGTYREVRAKQTVRQRRQRLKKPAVNGRLRTILGDKEYYPLYKRLLKEQGGVCAICKKPPGHRRHHMDHDKETLEIRGLLCWSCNYKLGFVEKYTDEIVRYLHGGG